MCQIEHHIQWTKRFFNSMPYNHFIFSILDFYFAFTTLYITLSNHHESCNTSSLYNLVSQTSRLIWTVRYRSRQPLQMFVLNSRLCHKPLPPHLKPHPQSLQVLVRVSQSKVCWRSPRNRHSQVNCAQHWTLPVYYFVRSMLVPVINTVVSIYHRSEKYIIIWVIYNNHILFLDIQILDANPLWFVLFQ